MAKRATASNNGTPKRRGRPPKKAQTTMAATPPSEKQELFGVHFLKIKAAKAALDKLSEERSTANGVYRSALKAAKSAGLDPDAIREVLSIQAREPDEVTMSFMNINSYLRWAGVPVGTQLGLFGDGVSVATRVDEDRMREQHGESFEEGRPLTAEATIAKAKTEGYEAGSDGKNPNICPYDEGSPQFLAWNAEWRRAQEKIADKFRTPAPQPEQQPAA